MKKIDKRDIWLLLAQVAMWIIILMALPLATLLSTHDFSSARTSFFVAWGLFHAPMVIYFVNFYILGPYLFFKRRFLLFALCNLVLILGMNYQFFFVWFNRNNLPDMPAMTTNMWIGFFSGLLMFLVLNCVIAAIAIGIRHFMQIRKIRKQLDEEKQKNTEAELAWLKSQINPHFLFNTLNNISSLIQIDPDAAQDSLAQLSDLLRYAMYESNKPTVSIQGEVEFMRNYIELMKLRCNNMTEVNTSFDVQSMEIAPLLFISLVENAFKHGVSSSRESKINISMTQIGNTLTFICDNTNYPKTDADRSGSGIGLENTRRRMELLYHDQYKWEQSILPDNIYHVKIVLNLPITNDNHEQ